MKKYMNRALLYFCLGLAAGVYYREFTKWNGFTGRSTLAFVHPHLLVLGALLCLLVALFSAQLPLASDKGMGLCLRLHDIGLPALAVTMLCRGTLQVLGTPLSKGMDAALSGLAGLSHVVLGTSLVLLVLSLRRLASQRG